MAVLGIKTHGFSPNSECLLILDAAGRAEAGVTFPVEYHFVTAMRTFKDIKSKITGVTENGLLYIIQDNRACFSGFIHFRDDVNIAGVIFNKVGSERHYQMLQQVCEDLGIACFGYLPKSPALEQGSRYLGLDFSLTPVPSPRGEGSDYFSSIADNILAKLSPVSLYTPLSPWRGVGGEALIARNAESFSFIYQETIDRFEDATPFSDRWSECGVAFFDPETEVPALADVDLLYLPGGYPEKHLDALVKNDACRKAIKEYAERGGRIVAECGGMMYLCERIVNDDGEYEMCGVLPYTITARKADRKLSLGYRRFVLDGRECRGHEFHYTQFLGEKPQSVTQVYNAKGEPVDTPVFKYKNVLASYTHLYQI